MDRQPTETALFSNTIIISSQDQNKTKLNQKKKKKLYFNVTVSVSVTVAMNTMFIHEFFYLKQSKGGDYDMTAI